MSARETADRVRDALWPRDAGPTRLDVFAVLDAARDERIYPAVLGCGLPYACLFTGDLPRELLETAPYLVRLEREAAFTDALLERGWGESWGIFASTTAGIEELRRHFRGFHRVEDERGKRLIFRWYDPRVLRVYLPTCTPAELRAFFGPVYLYSMEDEEPGALLHCHRDAGALGERRVILAGR